MLRLVAILMAAAVALAVPAAAQKAKLVDPYWTNEGSGSAEHPAWDAFLSEYAVLGGDGIRRVDYARAKSAGRAALETYLAALQAIDPANLARDEQFAYWVNLYNAATVAVVTDAYPVDSIRKIGGGLFSRGPWNDDVVRVAGRALTLNDIEHGILRPIWRDPRIHYVVNCASIGCPNLGERALTAAGLEDALDAAARAYVNHPRGARVENGKLRVSSIYHWYEEDFGGGGAGVIAHLRKYAEPHLATALQGVRRVSRHGYDWSLNGLR